MAEPTGGNPFDEGMDAFGRGIERSACPYPEESDEREIWLEGWDDAKHYAEDDEVRDNI
jgi:ribosome modulation factor